MEIKVNNPSNCNNDSNREHRGEIHRITENKNKKDVEERTDKFIIGIKIILKINANTKKK